MALPVGGPPSPLSPSAHNEIIQPPPRSSSRASIGSNTSTSSSASGASLSRKPRTRTRAKTLTGGRPENIRVPANASPSPDGDRAATDPVSVDAHSGGPNATTPTQAGFDKYPPPRPPRAPQRRSMTAVPAIESAFWAQLEARLPPTRTVSEVLPVEPTRISRAWSTGEAPRVVSDNWRMPPDSPSTETSFHFPLVPRPQIRDSLHTQRSTTTSSSSVFPPSTSSVSCPQSPSSKRSSLPFDNDNILSPSAVAFDGDDVSYRLQLLVKNNYFLPPAHSKPSPADFASLPRARKPTPTFLDIFRVGKTRSKPPTPDSSTDSLAPVLRTTSDSTTASGHIQRSAQVPTRSLPVVSPQDQARVVVVREKVEDLATAAKQAELDLKARQERDQASQRQHQSSLEEHPDIFDMIDPTELVDVPPPLDGYPFAMQTSTLQGLTVKDSIGAAELAEHLPPPHSPGMSSLDAEEAAWRKALLHEAVNLSLHSADTSFSSSGRGSSANDRAVNLVNQPSRTPSMKRILGQQILRQTSLNREVFGQVNETDRELPSFSNRTTSSDHSGRLGATLPTRDSENVSSRQNYLPRRAETPSTLHPLAPPPRKMSNPVSSLHVDVSRSGQSLQVRKSVSSPLLYEAYESGRVNMTPPPVPQVNVVQPQNLSSSSAVSSSLDSHHWTESMASSSSDYSHEEEVETDTMQARPSMTLSAERPSLSEYSQPSPRGSAFRDAFHEHYQSTRSSHDGQSSSRASAATPPPRFSTMSPPPRTSSSCAPMALSPPPRSSSLNQPARYQVAVSHAPALPTSPEHNSDWRASDQTIMQTVQAAEPVSSPIAERRGAGLLPEPLQIPVGHIPVSIHSAPPPSSPTSFFDQIESNAVDDIDSSDDSDIEGDYQTTDQNISLPPQDARLPPLPADLAHSTGGERGLSEKPSFMRLGNHSTPYVSRTGISSPVAYSFDDHKRTITMMSHRLPLFSRKKETTSDHGHGPVSNLDLFNFVQQPSLLEPGKERRSVSTENNVVAISHRQKDLESLRRLDGMLIQHMERERDTLKRIASNTLSKT